MWMSDCAAHAPSRRRPGAECGHHCPIAMSSKCPRQQKRKRWGERRVDYDFAPEWLRRVSGGSAIRIQPPAGGQTITSVLHLYADQPSPLC